MTATKRKNVLGHPAPHEIEGARTNWFPTPAHPPTHPGEYETRHDGAVAMRTRRYWSGNQWLFWRSLKGEWSPSRLDEMINAEWRGLAEPPKP